MQQPKTLSVFTKGNLELQLTPVPMGFMPSASSDTWMAFVGNGFVTPAFEFEESVIERIQAFMHECGTECLSDGPSKLTVVCNALVQCHPEAAADAICERDAKAEPVKTAPHVKVDAKHFIGQGALPWLIIGRIPGDDDDTGHLILADDEGEAQAIFAEQLHDDADNGPDEREDLIADHGVDHIITSSMALF